MKVGSFLLAALPLCAGLISGCGSASDNLNFKAPALWTATPSVLGMMQAWTNPRDTKQVLMLMKLPIGKDVNILDANTQLKDTKVTEKKTIKICGDQPARFVAMIGTSSDAKDDRKSKAEMVITSYGGSTYMAIYDRGANAPADPSAEAALKSICLKK